MWRSVYQQVPTPATPTLQIPMGWICTTKNFVGIKKKFRTGGGPTRKWKWISWKIRANDFDITFFTLSRYDSRPLKKFLETSEVSFLGGKPPKPELCEFFPAQPEVVSKIGRRLNSSWTCQSLELLSFLGWGVRGTPQKFPKFSVQNSYPPGIVRILP